MTERTLRTAVHPIAASDRCAKDHLRLGPSAATHRALVAKRLGLMWCIAISEIYDNRIATAREKYTYNVLAANP